MAFTTGRGRAGAAFFDLDRTLLKRASGPLLNDALVDAGLIPNRRVPGMGMLYKFNDLLGETLPAMAMARGSALLSKGWPVDQVRSAAERAAEQLVNEVAPYARSLIDDHRRAGRPVVLATTTPHDLIGPLAERLGFDAVVATRYMEDGGRYTGGLSGEFVWSRGKLRAVQRWADAEGIPLRGSYAYSDSIYDLPLLSAVGFPHAVNPDPRLQLVAMLRRWPVLHLDVPPGVPAVGGVEPLDVVRLLAIPQLFPYARFDIKGTDRIPRHGAAIVVSNHRSYFDPIALGLAVARSGRLPRFLGKKEVFDAPVLGQAVRILGQIRVDREGAGALAMREAERALAAGELIAILPQATIPRGEAFFDTVLHGKTGAARLAAATGAPVIPIGIWGTEKVWPRSARLPNVANVLRPPRVRIRVGPPVALTGDDAVADTERIMAAIVDQLPLAARQRHTPTPAEIAEMSPP
jgi:putative phosphoserine phosphatase/1-acylglycerol-3-phosphate O-acyltransferase